MTVKCSDVKKKGVQVIDDMIQTPRAICINKDNSIDIEIDMTCFTKNIINTKKVVETITNGYTFLNGCSDEGLKVKPADLLIIKNPPKEFGKEERKRIPYQYIPNYSIRYYKKTVIAREYKTINGKVHESEPKLMFHK